MKLPFFGNKDDNPAPFRDSSPVVMYSTRYCGFCMRARRLLNEKRVVFQEIAVDGDPDLWQEMKEKSGRNTVPQIFIAGIHIGGCDDLFALERDGQLDELLFPDEAPGAD